MEPITANDSEFGEVDHTNDRNHCRVVDITKPPRNRPSLPPRVDFHCALKCIKWTLRILNQPVSRRWETQEKPFIDPYPWHNASVRKHLTWLKHPQLNPGMWSSSPSPLPCCWRLYNKCYNIKLRESFKKAERILLLQIPNGSDFKLSCLGRV